MLPERLVVIDNDAEAVEQIADHFSREGFRIFCLSEKESSIAAIADKSPSLILYDVRLRRLGGLQFCRALKEDPRTRGVPQVIVSRRSAERDVLEGLALGVEAYISKPFKVRELLARIKAILRRAAPPTEPGRERQALAPDLEMDHLGHRVLLRSKELPLTVMEFKILRFLAARPHRVFTREEILAGVLGGAASISRRNVDVHVKSIREKLGVEHRKRIETVRGVGYRFRPQE
jgi:two-component system phosphate regulon response regulator PhoB